MNHSKAIELLASNQYERATKRKWSASSEYERNIWRDGAKSDLNILGVEESTYSGNKILPTKITKEQADDLVSDFCKRLSDHKEAPFRVAIIDAYNSFVETQTKGDIENGK